MAIQSSAPMQPPQSVAVQMALQYARTAGTACGVRSYDRLRCCPRYNPKV
jgi:hypothetical protein